MWQLYNENVMNALDKISSKSVQAVVTSPPYWRLRNYEISPTIWGGEENCKHDFNDNMLCSKCGAWQGSLGMELLPDCLGWATGERCNICYVCNLTNVFKKIKRVLRDDGTIWLNLGNSYNGKVKKANLPDNLKGVQAKQKDVLPIAWLVGMSLQADGWYLRSDVIWGKPNHVPESVKDRPTKNHEYVLFMSLSPSYYYDSEAIKEIAQHDGRKDNTTKGSHKYKDGVVPGQARQTMAKKGSIRWQQNEHGEYVKNRRSIWWIPTRSHHNMHSAVFPPDLAKMCILAGTSNYACEHCNSPWERAVAREQDDNSCVIKTAGWVPTCKCFNQGEGRSIVLDPFAGSGTTMEVAKQLGRKSIGIELSPKFCSYIEERLQKPEQTR